MSSFLLILFQIMAKLCGIMILIAIKFNYQDDWGQKLQSQLFYIVIPIFENFQ